MTSNDSFIGGIDLGGTKILSICADPRLSILQSDYRETDAALGPDAVIERMIESLKAAANGRALSAVGVSAPGTLDQKHGVITSAPNLPGWQDVHLGERLEQRLGVPTYVENDANAAAIAEHRTGAGRGKDHMLLVTCGTGIGGGLILDGRLYRGTSGAAGEVGHMQLDANGPVCGCGRRGCLEALASGRALGARAAAIVAAEPGGILARLAQGQPPDARLLEQAADVGDVSADAAIRDAGRYLGAGLTNLVNIFNPELIVIGGSLRKLGERYVGVADAVMRREAYPQIVADVTVVDALLGDEAPALGAAAVALDLLAADDSSSLNH